MRTWSLNFPLKPPRKPARDEAYKAYVRTFACCCGCGRWPSEAAHTGHDGGMRLKSSDRSCVPLFWECHREAHAIGHARFERDHGISFLAIVKELNRRYRYERPRRKPPGVEREARVLRRYVSVEAKSA